MSRAALVLLVVGCGGPAPTSAPLQGTRPAPAPTSTAPTVRWIDNGFDVTGLPAVASDGSVVLVPVIAEDGGRGNPNLVLVLKDRSDRELERHAVLTADEADTMFDAAGPVPALRERIAGAKARLVELHRIHDLRPLASLATESSPHASPAHHRAHGAELEVSWTTTRLTIRRGDRVVVDTTTPATWLTQDRPRCQDCTETCSNPAFLRAAHGDASRAVVLLTVAYGGTDLCWEPDSQHHVVAW